METLRCPNCEEPLPEHANYCTKCGESMTSPGHKSVYFLARQAQEDTLTLPSEPSQGETLHDSTIQGETIQDSTIQDYTFQDETLQDSREEDADGSVALMVATEPSIDNDIFTPHHSETPAGGNVPHSFAGAVNTPPGGTMASPEMGGLDTPHESFATSPHTPHNEGLMGAPGHGLNDKDFDPLSMRHMTWHKEVKPLTTHTPAPFLATPTRPPQTLLKLQRWRSKMPPVLFFWVSLAVIVVLLLGGVFGVIAALGHGPDTGNSGLSLTVSPNSVAVGATVTLRGTNFTPHGRIGLTRDTAIPIVDTGGAVVTQADSSGNFTDTVVVTRDWEAGQHMLYAEDAVSHKIASFPMIVTGGGALLAPAHLQLSAKTLDFGSDAQNVSSFRAITLTNIGSGQLPWLATTTQPWIQVGPRSGAIAGSQNQRIIIAVDRSHLQPGSYSGQVTFSSNAGVSTVTMTMQVTGPPSVPAGVAVLQASPPLLTFSAVDGGSAPPAQTITVSNPGAQTLQWKASSNSSWLSVSPQSGTVGVDGSGTLRVGVNTSTLLPGNYNGTITLSGAGSGQVQGSPQTINVSMTITPACRLRISPSILTFTGIDNQPAPSAQTVNLSVSQGCKSSLHWSESTSASWLNVSAQQGATPASPAIGVNSGGLTPGHYSGSVVFSSSAGTQSVFVNFTLGQQVTPLLSTSPSALTFTAVVGQGDPGSQAIQVTNSGSGTLAWQTTVATSVGGSWLAVTPGSGQIGAHQSISLGVSATLLSALTPGTYTSAITVSGADGAGHAAPGSPQTIPVTFVVKAACALTTAPTTLSFNGAVGASLSDQAVSLTPSGACGHTLDWSAQVGGGSWLSVTPSSGTATLSNGGSIGVGVNLSDLNPGVYHGTVTITATDSATQASIGSPQVVNVTLTVQPPCTLQAPSLSTLTFAAEAGTNPPTAQTFTIGVSGACPGAVKVTPSVSQGSSGWLSVSPSAANIQPGGSASFTVTVKSATLAPGSYSGSISLGGSGAITGSSQTVNVALTVTKPPALSVSPSSLTITVTAGPQSQPITIANTGNSPLSWTASLAKGDPSFVSLSSTSDKSLAGGASDTVNVIANGTGVQSGNYTATVTVTAIDPATGAPVAGSPVKVPVTITVAPPSMQLSATSLSFPTTGSNPDTQAITVTNSGGGTLTWQVGQPSASWLAVSPTSGSDPAGQSSQLTFTVDPAGLSAGNYTATVAITPSAGNAATVTVTLTVAAPPAMQVSPPSLGFPSNGSNPNVQSITVTNSGGGTLTWQVGQPSASWLVVSPTGGSDGAGASSQITFTVDPTGLSPGTYKATVAITPSTGNQVTETVILTITAPTPTPTPSPSPSPSPTAPPPAMQLSATGLSFPTTGSNPDAQAITVTNSGGGTLTWQVGQLSEKWLAVSPASGSDAAGASSSLTFTVDPTGLAPGNYPATAVITPSVGSPVTVTVTLTAAAPAPSPSPSPSPSASPTSSGKLA